MKKRMILALVLVCAMVFSGCSLLQQPKEREIIVFCDETLTDPEARAMGAELCTIPGVIQAEFVTAEDAFEEFMRHHDDEEAFAGVDASMLRHRYILRVETANYDDTVTAINAIDGVAKITE